MFDGFKEFREFNMRQDDKYALIIGSSNMDLNIYLERLPQIAETVTGGKFKQYLGGKGANQAVACQRSGTKTIFIGKIGKDVFGDQMLSQLSKENIDVSHLFRDPKETSGIAFILVDKKGENMISVAPGANANLTVEDLKEKKEIIERASTLIVQMEIPMDTISEIFQIANKGKVLKILNPAPLKNIPLKILKNIDIIVPNEGELFRLNSMLKFEDISGNQMKKIKYASKNVSKLGVKIVITTLGSEGAAIYHAEEDSINYLPAFKVKAVDTVGAGDCFNGVLASKLSQGHTLINSVKYAISAASIAVTRTGAQESMPYQHEIENRYKEYNKLYKEEEF
jgi:ribokinase